MCKLYGIQNFVDLGKELNIFCYPILNNIEVRREHLQYRLKTFEAAVKDNNSVSSFDKLLINNTNYLCEKLNKLFEQVEKTKQAMEDRDITVKSCLQKYKENMKSFQRLYGALMQSLSLSETNSDKIDKNILDIRAADSKRRCAMGGLDKLSSEQNTEAVDCILADVEFRKEHFSSLFEEVMSLYRRQPDGIKIYDLNINEAKKLLETIPSVEEELNYIRRNLQAIKEYIVEYGNLMQDDEFKDIPCSKFILLLERLRIRTEELAVSKYFPEMAGLLKTWQNDHNTDNKSKPKALDLVKAVEMDIKNLLSDRNCIYTFPYKIGVIGDGSVGKSALIMNLTNENQISSMVNIERSTFSYLQFDTFFYENPQNNQILPITFIDVEGATDTDKNQSIGNYLELIGKADCDLYIIVFDKIFSDQNRTSQDHIENVLKRKCVLVRNKVDSVFKQFYHQIARKKYEQKTSKRVYQEEALQRTRDHSLITFDDKRLIEKVYLTAAACEDDIKGESFAKFDLDELKAKFVQMASTDLRVERIYKRATIASITIINTCFRRGYIVSKEFYQILSTVAGILPLLDELSTFLGREKIRQTFGIHDDLSVKNKLSRKKDAFEQYLTEKKLKISRRDLKSGSFDYLKIKEKKQTITIEINSSHYVEQELMCHVNNKKLMLQNAPVIASNTMRNIAGPATIAASAIGKVISDAKYAIIPSASVVSRTVPFIGIAASLALAPAFAVWSYHSTGQRMDEYLHLVCDDLVIILTYFIINLCNECCHSRKLFPVFSTQTDTSSTDDE